LTAEPSTRPLHAALPIYTADALFRLTQGLEPAGLWWLSGYAAGLASRGATSVALAAATPRADAADSPRLTILYGSQTGNARRARSEEHTSELQSRENLVC